MMTVPAAVLVSLETELMRVFLLTMVEFAPSVVEPMGVFSLKKMVPMKMLVPMMMAPMEKHSGLKILG
jgi:hypothetical protein